MIICLTLDEVIVGTQLQIGCSDLYAKMFCFSKYVRYSSCYLVKIKRRNYKFYTRYDVH